jgi:hypothetical protein
MNEAYAVLMYCVWYTVRWSRGSSAGIETNYGLDSRVSIPGRGKIFFSTPQHPDRPRGPPNLMSVFTGG